MRRNFFDGLQCAIRLCIKHLLLIPFGVLALSLAPIARCRRKPVDVGIGPEPLINQRFHKQAFAAAGYSAETFVTHLFYYSDDFDIICKRGFLWRCLLALRCLFRYRALCFYFKGGPFAWTGLLRLEPWIYKLAGIKTVVTGYGGDCQDFNHCPNLLFKNAINQDYPHVLLKNARTRQRVDRWTRHADHIISGCDWVDYTPRWNSLCLAHFTVDTEKLCPPDENISVNSGKITILHAPNHTEIKGSRYFKAAIEELRAEGYDVELVFVQNMPNSALRELILRADIIADQLIIGWYGMFAVEGMSAGKPVLCYLRDDLLDLYTFSGVLGKDEIPIVQCTRHNVKDKIRYLLENKEEMQNWGQRSRAFAIKYHSVSAMSRILGNALQKAGVLQRGRSCDAKYS